MHTKSLKAILLGRVIEKGGGEGGVEYFEFSLFPSSSQGVALNFSKCVLQFLIG
jgi:hypothetical protein